MNSDAHGRVGVSVRGTITQDCYFNYSNDVVYTLIFPNSASPWTVWTPGPVRIAAGKTLRFRAEINLDNDETLTAGRLMLGISRVA